MIQLNHLNEIQEIIDRNSVRKKHPKYKEDSITVVLSFHLELHIVFDVLIRAHEYAQKSPILKAVLPKPPHVSLRKPKPLRGKLLRSKLKLTDDTERGNFPYGTGNYEIYNVLRPGKGFKAHLKDLQLYDEGRRQLFLEKLIE